MDLQKLKKLFSTMKQNSISLQGNDHAYGMAGQVKEVQFSDRNNEQYSTQWCDYC